MGKINIFIFIFLILPFWVFAQNQENYQPKAGITPGSKFYFLDKFSEKVREFFAFSPEAKVRLQISFATERTAEIKKLLETKGVDSKELATAKAGLEAHNLKITKIVDKDIKEDGGIDKNKLYDELNRNIQLTNETIGMVERLKQERRVAEEEQGQYVDQEIPHENARMEELYKSESERTPADNHKKVTSTPRISKLPIPTDTIVPNLNHGEGMPSLSNLKNQFSVLEQELAIAKNSKAFLSETHYERIKKDLDNLKRQGYSASEVDRLHGLAIDLSPHITDQKKTVDSVSNPTSSLCTANSKPQLIADITEFSKIQKISAPGTQSSEGPKGHAFIWTGGQRVSIYAPIDAVLESGAYSRDTADSPAQYNLTFNIKGYCFKFRFDHIDEPVDKIKSVLPLVPKIADSRGTFLDQLIEFKTGELIGYTKGNPQSGNWDFGLYDMSKEGVLAQHGSTGIHLNSVCWPDYYLSDKYKKLLEGSRLVCDQVSSSPLISPLITSANKDPVLKNLGVSFEAWDRSTNRAGAFIFSSSENKVFLEYGVEVPSSEGGTKILPTFEYRTDSDADVLSVIDGLVTKIDYQSNTQDYEVLIQPEENSQWTLGQDHISNLRVAKGDKVKAGDILGKVGTLGGNLGRTEIMLWKSSSTRPVTYCPLKYFDPQLLAQYKQKIQQHMKDWEEFKGNLSLYNEDKHFLPGCIYETLLD